MWYWLLVNGVQSPAAAGGEAARWWLLGILTCLCLGILVAAAWIGGMLFMRSRHKSEAGPPSTPSANPPSASSAPKPAEAAPAPEPATLPKARLVVVQGLVDRRLIELTTQTMTIGRDATNTLVVNDAIASRHHARIEPVNNRWMIVDKDSVNGTRVNGKGISRQALNNGDRIEIGTAVIEFQIVQ